MRVLLVTGSLPPMRCGVGDYSWKLAMALARQGVEVGVLTSVAGTARNAKTSDVESIPPGVTVFPVMPHWHAAAATTAWRVLRAWKPDVVHIQYPTQGYGAGRLPSLMPLLAALAGARVVRTWHEIPSGREKTFLLQALVRGCYIVTREIFGDAMPPLARRLLRRNKRSYIPIASNIPVVTLAADERRTLRSRYLGEEPGLRMIVYFGFLYRFKGADQLFEIADPVSDRLVFIGDTDVDPDYTAEIAKRAEAPPWKGKAFLLGYMDEGDIARHLAAADAVALPFRRGGGIGNGTIHAAVLQGTPVVTTARDRRGLDEEQAIYYAAPDDVDDLRRGLASVAGRRHPARVNADRADWDRMAMAHLSAYARECAKTGTDRA